MKFRGAVLRECPGELTVEELSVTGIGRREVLVRTAAAGLCHSDLHYLLGDYTEPTPVLMGHESAGVVEAVGAAVETIAPGDHVITCLSTFCGGCDYCLVGKPFLCGRRGETRRPDRVVDVDGIPVPAFVGLGSFAEQLLVHENACVPITKDMPLDVAALIGCAVITGVGVVWNTAGVRPGDTVVVIGCGGVGLNVVQGAYITGASRIIAVDLADSKLATARAFGATDLVQASDGRAVEAVMDLTRGGAHHVFEAIGLKRTAEQAVRMLRPDGAAYIVGMVPQHQTVDIAADVFMSGRRIHGSVMGSNRFRLDMPAIVDLYLQGRLKLDELISDRIALADINAGFEQLRGGATTRTLVVF